MSITKSFLCRRPVLTGIAMAGAMMVASPAPALEILNDWTADFTSVGGDRQEDMIQFESDGQTFVVQQGTGAGGAVQDGDRFYELAFLKVSSYRFNTGAGQDGNSIDNLITGGKSLYFFVEGGGTVDIPGPVGESTFNFDFARSSLLLDDPDEGLTDANEVANQDGQTFASLRAGIDAALADGSFSMPLAVNDFGALSTDATLTLLAQLELGELAGTIPSTGFIPGSSLDDGNFGATLGVTACAGGFFFDAADNDLCDSADPNVDLTDYLWTANGTVTTASTSEAITNNLGETFFVANQTLGDAAAPAAVPLPGTVALLGLGLAVMGVGTRIAGRRRDSMAA